jgi:hypothetical protein
MVVKCYDKNCVNKIGRYISIPGEYRESFLKKKKKVVFDFGFEV